MLFLLSTVSAQCLTGNDSPAMMSPASKKALTDARFAFALESLKKTASIETNDNIFYSPHSLHEALALTYFGSRGTTEEALRKTLHIPNELSKIDMQRFYAYENSLKLEAQVSPASGLRHYQADRNFKASFQNLESLERWLLWGRM